VTRRIQKLWRSPILYGVALIVVAFFHFHRVFPPTDLGGDPVRDQLMARDCTELGRCYLSGADASFPNLYHGAVWIDLIVAVRVLGGDFDAQRCVVLALLAISVGTFFVVVWRWIGAAIAFPAAILFVGLLDASSSPTNLTNPSTAIFFDVLAAAALLCHALSGMRRFLFVSAVSIGIGIGVHDASASLFIPFVAIAALSRERPWAGIAGSVALMVGVYAMSSMTALEINLHTLEGYRGIWIALTLVAILVALSALVGDSFRRLSPAARAWVIGAILILPFGVAILWIGVVQRHDFAPHYYHPVIAPVAAMGGAALFAGCRVVAHRMRFRASAPGMWASLIALTIFPPWHSPSAGQTGEWNFTEARAVAEEISKRGWSYEDLVFQLQSNQCYDLLVMMSLVAPPPRPELRPYGHQIQVIKTTRDAIADVGGVGVVAIPGETQVLAVREIESWLRPELTRVCRKPAVEGLSATCAVARDKFSELNSPERFRFARRSLPEIYVAEPARPYVESYEIPVFSIPGGTRDFVITMPETEPGCGWRFTRVEGLIVDEPLPSTMLHARSISGGPGRLVVEVGVDRVRCKNTTESYPPCVFEILPDDPLRALIAKP
jgi:hypothetical protein